MATNHGIAGGFTSEGALTEDNLIAGSQPPMVTESVTLKSGESVVRGEVLGRESTDNKFLASLAAAVDGSQVPSAIALETVDASAADAKISVAFAGVFNGDALTVGAGHTVASILAGLQARGVYIRTNLGTSYS